MASPKRKLDEIERDRQLTAKLYLQGKQQEEIAKILSDQYTFTITQQQVSYDLKIIRGRWKQSSIRDFDDAKTIAIAEIDLMRSELWQAWDKSKETGKVVSRKQGGKCDGEITTRIEHQIGNPAYMTALRATWESRCKILGIDAGVKYDDLNLAIAAVIRAGFIVQNPTVDVTAIEVLDSAEDGSID